MGQIGNDKEMQQRLQAMKEKIAEKKQQESNSGYTVNQYGEIVRKQTDKAERTPATDDSDIADTVRTLVTFAKMLEVRKKWKLCLGVNVLAFAIYLFWATVWLSATLIDGFDWIPAMCSVLLLFNVVGIYGKKLSMEEDRKDSYFHLNVFSVVKLIMCSTPIFYNDFLFTLALYALVACDMYLQYRIHKILEKHGYKRS